MAEHRREGRRCGGDGVPRKRPHLRLVAAVPAPAMARVALALVVLALVAARAAAAAVLGNRLRWGGGLSGELDDAGALEEWAEGLAHQEASQRATAEIAAASAAAARGPEALLDFLAQVE